MRRRRRIRLHVSPAALDFERPDACSVLRLIDPYSAPELADDLEVSFAHGGPSDAVDILVLQREGWVGATVDDIHACVRAVRLAGGKVIYDVDDNFLDPHPDPLADLGLRNYRPVCRYLLREADRVTVSTPFLRDRCLRLNPHVEVLPNCINPARFGPLRKRADNDVLTIGCWGLPTHAQDLASIIRPLRAALGEIRPMARVVFCGIYRNSRLQDAFEGCGRLERLEPVPEYASFLQLMAGQQWDIGLAPLVRGKYADCKADIKLLEYGAFGIAGVFSRHPAYVTVEDGITGLIAEGDGWTDTILRLARDGELRTRIAANVREYALRERSVSASLCYAMFCCERSMAEAARSENQPGASLALQMPRRRRFRVHVSPEGPSLLDPGACAALRLIDPYSSRHLADDFDVSFAQRGPSETVDVLVLQRDAWASATVDDVHACVRAVRLTGGKIIYDLDDNLLDPYLDPVVDSVPRRYRPVSRYLLREADWVTVSTPSLLKRCLRLNPRIEVLPNFINPERFGLVRAQADNGALTIGCYGTFTHERGLASIIAPLRAALRQIRPSPRVIFCGIYRNARLQDALKGYCTLETLPTEADYFSFLRLMAGQRWDIGLAPLARGMHEDCKSDLKFLEYGALGIAGVYSRHPAYDSVKNGETGLLAEGEEWTDTILCLAHDADLRAQIAANAREYALRERSVSAGAPLLRGVLLKTLAG